LGGEAKVAAWGKFAFATLRKTSYSSALGGKYIQLAFAQSPSLPRAAQSVHLRSSDEH